jgi:PRTRC genetic system ThiF family protein
VNAASLVLPPRDLTRLYLVGCGGTGSWIAPALARLAGVLVESNQPVEVTFIDPDRVERGNVPRQNFAFSEIGQRKAATLARRFSSKWGVEIGAISEHFEASMVESGHGELNVIIGAVDNPQARSKISSVLVPRYDIFGYQRGPSCWWLDCGNHEDAGQVLVGSAGHADHLKGAFHTTRLCIALPSPALQSPELVIEAKKKPVRKAPSCAELMIENAQSLTVNQRVAAEASDYLMRMLTGRPLKRFQTWLDLDAGTSRSVYITPENVARVIDKSAGFVMKGAK